MDDDRLIVKVTHLDDAAVLTVCGEIDMASTPVLRSALDRWQTSGVSVVLDFAGVTFMDSSGLSLLIGASTRSDNSATFCVRYASERVRRILQLTGTEYLLCEEP